MDGKHPYFIPTMTQMTLEGFCPSKVVKIPAMVYAGQVSEKVAYSADTHLLPPSKSWKC